MPLMVADVWWLLDFLAATYTWLMIVSETYGLLLCLDSV